MLVELPPGSDPLAGSQDRKRLPVVFHEAGGLTHLAYSSSFLSGRHYLPSARALSRALTWNAAMTTSESERPRPFICSRVSTTRR